ncbi:MAG: hypothetical protein EHM90_03545 [Chloroflexi bacterium]|nr:MAG: hypothetical protein EHM90_03545 [Chloroflexota bacterium]
MQKRHSGLRAAGWIGVLAGVIGLAIGAFGGSDVARLAGAYGMLLLLSGGWAVIGVQLLMRHERRSSQIPQPAVAEQRGVISR